jgi:hypothetical protein
MFKVPTSHTGLKVLCIPEMFCTAGLETNTEIILADFLADVASQTKIFQGYEYLVATAKYAPPPPPRLPAVLPADGQATKASLV